MVKTEDSDISSGMASCRIRLAEETDLPAIKALFDEWGRAFGCSRNDQFFVAETLQNSDQEIIGVINLVYESPVLVIRSLYVAESHRHEGVACQLIAAVNEELALAEAYCVCHRDQEYLGNKFAMQTIGGMTAPTFLRERLANLKESYPDVILMKRSKGIEVRPINVDDLLQVMGLIAEFELAEVRQLSENDIRNIYSRIASAGGVVFGAFRGSRLLGTCTLNICANLSWSGRPYGILENIIVTESERNKGIGRYLLLMASRSAVSKDCYKLALMTQQRTEGTKAFYKSAGFSADKVGYQIRFHAPLGI